MDFKTFVNYAVVAFNHLREENKTHSKKMTAKQLAETIWLMYYLYNEQQVNEKAKKILSSLELI